MSVYLDVLPRLGLTEAEVAFDKLKGMAKKTGEEMGLSLGEGASAGLDKLKAGSVSAERAVSDDYRKMIVSAQQYEAQVKKVAEVEAARGRDSAAFAAATAKQTDLQLRATQAQTDHAAATTAAAAASTKYATAQEGSGLASAKLAGVLNGAGLAAFLATGVAIGATADKAADFEQGLTKLQAAAGELPQNMKAVSDGILQVSIKTGYSAGQLSDAMYVIEKAGFRGADGIKVLSAAAQGASSEQADLGEVVDGLTTSMKDFNVTPEQSARLMSQMVTAVGEAKTNFQDFAGALHSVEPAAAAAHLKLEDVWGTLAQMTQSGTSPAQAAVDMNQAITSLARPSDIQIAKMRQLGINGDEVSQKLGQNGLAGTLQGLYGQIAQRQDASTKLVDTGQLTQAGGALSNLHDMLNQTGDGALSDGAKSAAKAYLDGTISAKEYRKAVQDSNDEDKKKLLQFGELTDKVNAFSKRLAGGRDTLETTNAALGDVVGTGEAASVAFQTTGENAQSTNDKIAAIAKTTQEANGTVKGFDETQGTLNAQMREAKAAFGAAAIEMGDNFIPVLKTAAGALKTTAEFIAEHKQLMTNAAIAVGAFGIAWAGVKVALAVGNTFSAIAGGIDIVVGKFARMGGAAATAAAEVDTAAASEVAAQGRVGVAADAAAAQVRGVGSAALTAAGLVGGLAYASTQASDAFNKWSDDHPDVQRRDSGGKIIPGRESQGGGPFSGAVQVGTLPVAGPDQSTRPGAQAARRNLPAQVPGAPVPGAPIPPVSPSSDPGIDPGIPDFVPSESGTKGKKAPKGEKNDPIWIAPQNPDDFKGDGSGGVTGSSILKGGFNFLDPKSIGTFFTAMLADLAVGNPLGKTFAKELGGSASNPMYITSVDVDKAQTDLDKAIRGYGPDSTEAKTAAGKLQATQAMVGTSGGYYDPQTGSVSQRDLSSGGAAVRTGPGAEGWRSTVAATVAKYGSAAGIPEGQYGNWTDAIVRQIQTESSGNPGADNPNDSNGRGGTQHVAGLLQYLPSTYANSAQKLTGNPNMMDPVSQIAGALLAGKNAAGGPMGIGNGVGWGPSRQPVAAPSYGNPALDDPLTNYRGGGGESPVFRTSPPPSPGGPPPGATATATPGVFWDHDKGTFVNAQGQYVNPSTGNAYSLGGQAGPRLAPSAPSGRDGLQVVGPPGGTNATLPQTGTGLFNPGGILGGQPGPMAARPIPGMNIATAGVQSAGGAGGPRGATGGGTPGGAAPAANAAPAPRSWGSGKGATSSLGSSLGGALGSVFPGAQQAGQLLDRTIGYVGQLGGIAVEGLMQSLIPTGGGGGIGDPSHSVIGKLAGGIAGAHKSAPNTAGTTAPPMPSTGDQSMDKSKGGDTTHVGSQNNGVVVQGDMHVSTPDAGSMKQDTMTAASYPTQTR